MPTNKEYLDQLASESPDKLKAWFDAEHEIDTSNKSSVNVTDSSSRLVEWAAFARTHEGELINEVRVNQAVIDSLSQELDDITDERNMLQRRNDELRTSYDKLKRERDNLAADLLTCNREREHLRKNLGIALDHAHDICALVDIGE